MRIPINEVVNEEKCTTVTRKVVRLKHSDAHLEVHCGRAPGALELYKVLYQVIKIALMI